MQRNIERCGFDGVFHLSRGGLIVARGAVISISNDVSARIAHTAYGFAALFCVGSDYAKPIYYAVGALNGISKVGEHLSVVGF